MLVGERFGFHPKPEITQLGEYVTSPVYVGVELEFSYAPSTLGRMFWMWHSDGSIRGSLPGELVLRAPQNPRGFDLAMREFQEEVAIHVEVNDSCGVHVHVDVCDLTFEELRRVLLLYSTLERTLYKYCGGNRDQNNFCIPLGECGERLDWFRNNLTIDRSLRYCGLNLASVRKFGSLEFRMHPGSTDPKRIGEWAGICTRIKDYGRRVSVDTLYDVLQGSTSDFLWETMAEHGRPLEDVCTKQDLYEGVREGKEIYFASVLMGANNRMISVRKSRRRNNTTSPYDKWLGSAQPERVVEVMTSTQWSVINLDDEREAETPEDF